MKPESSIDILKKITDDILIIRGKLISARYNQPLTMEDEMVFWEAKGRIARHLQPLRHKAGNPGDYHNVMIAFLRRIASLNQISQLNSIDLLEIEKDCHKIFLFLNRWQVKLSSN